MEWKIDLPGPGSSCPIVHGNRLYLTCYTGFGVDATAPGKPADLVRHLIAIDRSTGRTLWTADVPSTHDEDPYKGFILEHGYASSTPVTDGKHIYVMFGKTGVIAFDWNSNEVWRTHVGVKSDPAQWGDGASPILYKDLVIVNAGITDNAFIALNQSTGKEVWRISDPSFTNCWSTPIIVSLAERDELVCCSPGKIFGVDPLTGKEYWRATSPINQTVCASTVESEGIVYLMGGRAGTAFAVRCGGSGDVTTSNILWEKPLRSGIGTPVIVNHRMYWSASGMAICTDCKTGQEVFKERIQRGEGAAPAAEGGGRRGPSSDYASAVVIGDKILVVSRSGESQFWNASTKYEPLTNNAFGDDPGPFNSTPAISDGRIFIRSNRSLYCIGS